MNNPKISILIPVYNVEKYISRCIDSILAQTYQDFEIVIINDCTPDNSIDIIQQYIKKDSRIILLHNECNKGLMYSRYAGYSNAKGEYIIFVDSDDSLPEDALETLIGAIENTDSDIVAGCYTYISPNGKNQYYQNKLSNGGESKDTILQSFFNAEFSFSLCGKIYKRNIFENNTFTIYPDFTNSEDTFLSSEIISKNYTISVVDKSVYNYYLNSESSSNRRLSKSRISCILKTWEQLFSVSKNSKNLLSAYDKYIFFYLRSYIKSDYDKKQFMPRYSNYFTFKTIREQENNIISAIYTYFLMNCRAARFLHYRTRILWTLLKSAY